MFHESYGPNRTQLFYESATEFSGEFKRSPFSFLTGLPVLTELVAFLWGKPPQETSFPFS